MYVGWEALRAVNTAGGIILMWDKQVLERIDSHIGQGLGFTGLIWILCVVIFGRSLCGCGVTGLLHGVCLGILMSSLS